MRHSKPIFLIWIFLAFFAFGSVTIGAPPPPPVPSSAPPSVKKKSKSKKKRKANRKRKKRKKKKVSKTSGEAPKAPTGSTKPPSRKTPAKAKAPAKPATSPKATTGKKATAKPAASPKATTGKKATAKPAASPKATTGKKATAKPAASPKPGDKAAPADGDKAKAATTPTKSKPATEKKAKTPSTAPKDTAATAKKAAKPKAKEPEPAGPKFIKGHLVHVGTRQMLSRFNHIGVNFGAHIIGSDVFLGLDPGLAFYWDTFAFALHAPLRLQAVGLTGTTVEYGSLKPRLEDWDDTSEYARFIRFVTIGRKEENVYFTINTMRPATIGHGMLMDKYQANIDIDRFMTGMIFDAYNDYAGFQAQVNDITLANQMAGALVFIKPLSLVSDNILAKSLSLGAEYIADMRAPICIEDDNGSCVQGSGQMGGVGPYAEGNSAEVGPAPDNNAVVHPDSLTGLPRVKTGLVQALGFSGEFKFLKIGREIDVKVYATHHKFLNTGGGSGSAGGLLARLNLGDKWIHAFRLRGEYRTFEDGFIPGYFDSLYEVSKYGYFPKAYQHQVTPTKYQGIFGDPDNGFARENFGRRHGFRLEGEWGLFKGSRRNKQVAVGFGISDSNGPDDSNFHAHLELPYFGFVQVFGSIMRFGMKSLSNISDINFSSIDNKTIVLSGLRFQFLPFLFLNTHFAYNFRRAAGATSEYNIATDQMPYYEGRHPRLHSTNFFENVPTLFVELEIGWEVGDDDPVEPVKEDK